MVLNNERKKLEEIHQNYYNECSNLKFQKRKSELKINKLKTEILSLENENKDINNDILIKKIINKTNKIIELENNKYEIDKNILYIEYSLCSLENIINGNTLKCKNNSEILAMNENDRQRIARELHDLTIQNLIHLIHKVEYASKFIENDPIKTRLEMAVISKVLKETIAEIRELVYDLRPMTFDDFGFEIALKTFLENITSNLDINFSYHINYNLENYDDLFLITLFRIIQECINNSVKHSECKNIKVEIKQVKDELLIIIEDDGIGIDIKILNESDKHFGIKIIKERVSLISGVCNFICKKGKGLAVEIRVPIQVKKGE